MAPSNNETPKSPQPGRTELIATLAGSGDNWIKLITIVLIALSGGGNFFATREASRLNEHEVNRALREIHDVHGVMDEALSRQKHLEQILEEIRKK